MTDLKMSGKVALVTGANTGIGKETARGLAAAGATTVLLCRSQERGDAAAAEIRESSGNQDVHVVPCDLASFTSIRLAAGIIEHRWPMIAVLVNNAGLWSSARTVTEDGLETTMQVNHFGPYLLTGLLLPALLQAEQGRIVVVSSSVHKRSPMPWQDLQAERKYSSVAAYNYSKLANLLFTYALARRLRGTAVTVNAVNPGLVASDIWRTLPAPVRLASRLFFKSPKQGAETTLYAALDPSLARVSGQYLSDRKAVASSAASLVEGDQERLWQISEELTGFRYPLGGAGGQTVTGSSGATG